MTKKSKESIEKVCYRLRRDHVGCLLVQRSMSMDLSQKSMIGELLQLNCQIAKFILREIEADKNRAKAVAVEQAWQLGRQLVELGRELQKQAEERLHDPEK